MKKIALFLAIAAAALACKPEETVTPEVKVLSDAADLVIAQDGSEPVYIDFEANVDWTAELKDASAADWCTITPKEGKAGEGKVRVLAGENTTNDNRVAVVVIKAQSAQQEVSVTQLQKNALVAGATALEVAAEGGEVKVTLSHNVDYEVAIEGEWLTQATTKALTETELVFNAAANPTLEERVAKITITAGDLKQEVTVTQAAFVPTFEFSAAEVWIDALGGSGDVTITADYDFELTTAAEWLKITNEGDTYTFTAVANAGFDYRAAEIVIEGWTKEDDPATKDVNEAQKFYVFQNGRASVKWQKNLVTDYSMTLAAGAVRMAMSGEYIIVANNGAASLISKADGSVVKTVTLPAGITSVTNDDAGHIVLSTDMVYNPVEKKDENGETVKDDQGNPVIINYNDPAKVYYLPSLEDDPVELGEITNENIWTNGSGYNLRVKGDVTKDAVVVMTLPGINYWVGFEVKAGVAGERVYGGLSGVNGYGYGHGVFCPLGSTLADGIAAFGYGTPYNLYISDDAAAQHFVTSLPQDQLINPDDTHWNGNDDPNSLYKLQVGDREYIACGIGTHFSYTQARVNVYDITDHTAGILLGKLRLPESSSSWVGSTGAWSDVVAEVAGDSILVYYVSGNNQTVLCFEII